VVRKFKWSIVEMEVLWSTSRRQAARSGMKTIEMGGKGLEGVERDG